MLYAILAFFVILLIYAFSPLKIIFKKMPESTHTKGHFAYVVENPQTKFFKTNPGYITYFPMRKLLPTLYRKIGRETSEHSCNWNMK
jgi:hypothetical protein